MKRFEVKAICTMVFPDIFANNKHDAIQEVINKLPTNVEKDGVLKCAVIVDDVKAECYDLMDTSNNHNAELVERINRAYEENKEDFVHIVKFLADRDSHVIVGITNRLPRSLDERTLCYTYCQNVADDQDLETILCYCRM
jgi:aspartyl aminopeptidase